MKLCLYLIMLIVFYISCSSSNSVDVKPANLGVDAGENREININENIVLTGTVSDYAIVSSYEWKIGENEWVITPGPSISIITPSTGGPLKCYFRVTGNNGFTEVDSVFVMVISSDLFKLFNVPSKQGLPDINGSYKKLETTGSNPPDLSSVISFAFNYMRWVDDVAQFSFTSSKQPYYLSLNQNITFQFANPEPQFSLTGSGIDRLDGAYYVSYDSNRLVWVRTDGSFAIVFTL